MASSGVLWRMDALAEERFPSPVQGALRSAASFRSSGCGAAASLRLLILTPTDLWCLLACGTLHHFLYKKNSLKII